VTATGVGTAGDVETTGATGEATVELDGKLGAAIGAAGAVCGAIDGVTDTGELERASGTSESVG
jgi:hypothetical protein